jgi:hypothetical protein
VVQIAGGLRGGDPDAWRPSADGCSAEALRSRLARARRALRTVLRRGFPELCSDEIRVHDDV